jgi:hypothetical protein
LQEHEATRVINDFQAGAVSSYPSAACLPYLVRLEAAENAVRQVGMLFECIENHSKEEFKPQPRPKTHKQK